MLVVLEDAEERLDLPLFVDLRAVALGGALPAFCARMDGKESPLSETK